MGRDKKHKPKKTEKQKREKQAKRNLIERQRQDELDDLIQQLLRFLPDRPEVRILSRQQVFDELYDVAFVHDIKAYKVEVKVMVKAEKPEEPEEQEEIHPDQPGPSGIDYEAERLQRWPRMENIYEEVEVEEEEIIDVETIDEGFFEEEEEEAQGPSQ